MSRQDSFLWAEGSENILGLVNADDSGKPIIDW